jgi:hypothetical protein
LDRTYGVGELLSYREFIKVLKNKESIMYKFNKEDVFSFSYADEARDYKGKECYFEDSYAGLQYCIDNNIKGLLKCVRDDDDDSVDCIFVADCDMEVMDGRYIRSFGLCLPCELVKIEKEPKFRPFKSVEEFKSVVGEIGSVICFKPINCNAKYSVMFLGVLEDEFGKTNVLTGGIPHDFAELFEEYVLLKDGKEVPFGIKDDDDES